MFFDSHNEARKGRGRHKDFVGLFSKFNRDYFDAKSWKRREGGEKRREGEEKKRREEKRREEKRREEEKKKGRREEKKERQTLCETIHVGVIRIGLIPLERFKLRRRS